jgi:putative redox protein
MNASAIWKEKMQFTGTAGSGHNLIMDSAPETGGEQTGFRPKELVLQGLAGCTAMDVMSILSKMKIVPKAFRVEVSAEQTEEHPKVFNKIHLKYIVSGDVPEDKLIRAIELSEKQYCGVSAMLGKTAKITYEHIYE